MRRPIEPNKEDCCNSGCNPCIFDVYDKQLAAYEKYLELGETDSDDIIQSNAISELNYTSFKLLKSVDICESHKVLMFRKLDNKNSRVKWKPGDHFLVKFSCRDQTCSRAYTPLQLEQYSNCDFSVIVKNYVNGSVSNYLSNLVEGEHSLWRGPYGSYELVHNKYRRIIMIAQGTGLVSFISIIQKIISNEDDMTRIILYYCCPSDDKILLRDELYMFKDYWNFTYKIFLSETSSNAKFKYQEPVIQEKLNFDNIMTLQPFSSNDQFLLCGSLLFMEYYATILKAENFESDIIKL